MCMILPLPSRGNEGQPFQTFPPSFHLHSTFAQTGQMAHVSHTGDTHRHYILQHEMGPVES